MAKKAEIWQLYDQAGRPLKIGRPAEQYNSGQLKTELFAVAGVWVWRRIQSSKQIEILFQKRAPKIHNGGKWDISTGGHVNLGEMPFEAAIREAKEEIGLKINSRKLIFMLSFNNSRNIAFIYLYEDTRAKNFIEQKNSAADFQQNFSDKTGFHLDKNEVSEIKWVPLSQLADFYHNCKESLASNEAQLRILIKTLTMFQNQP